MSRTPRPSPPFCRRFLPGHCRRGGVLKIELAAVVAIYILLMTGWIFWYTIEPPEWAQSLGAYILSTTIYSLPFALGVGLLVGSIRQRRK